MGLLARHLGFRRSQPRNPVSQTAPHPPRVPGQAGPAERSRTALNPVGQRTFPADGPAGRVPPTDTVSGSWICGQSFHSRSRA